MELLLNLLWLIGIPAFGVWWLRSGSGVGTGRIARIQQIALLGCMLVLLFPVVSATDDLHPIRPEIEESSSSKRIQQAAADQSSTHFSPFGAPPALLSSGLVSAPSFEVLGHVHFLSESAPEQAQFSFDASRAPPAFFLG
jgi:hypothetical protein